MKNYLENFREYGLYCEGEDSDSFLAGTLNSDIFLKLSNYIDGNNFDFFVQYTEDDVILGAQLTTLGSRVQIGKKKIDRLIYIEKIPLSLFKNRELLILQDYFTNAQKTILNNISSYILPEDQNKSSIIKFKNLDTILQFLATYSNFDVYHIDGLDPSYNNEYYAGKILMQEPVFISADRISIGFWILLIQLDLLRDITNSGLSFAVSEHLHNSTQKMSMVITYGQDIKMQSPTIKQLDLYTSIYKYYRRYKYKFKTISEFNFQQFHQNVCNSILQSEIGPRLICNSELYRFPSGRYLIIKYFINQSKQSQNTKFESELLLMLQEMTSQERFDLCMNLFKYKIFSKIVIHILVSQQFLGETLETLRPLINTPLNPQQEYDKVSFMVETSLKEFFLENPDHIIKSFRILEYFIKSHDEINDFGIIFATNLHRYCIEKSFYDREFWKSYYGFYLKYKDRFQEFGIGSPFANTQEKNKPSKGIFRRICRL